MTKAQFAMLARLNDGPAIDSVGLEVSALNSHEIGVCDRLVDRGLASFSVGWRMSMFYRLTDKGRMTLNAQARSERLSDRHMDSRRT
jgi:hypothetical protein